MLILRYIQLQIVHYINNIHWRNYGGGGGQKKNRKWFKGN